MSIACNITTSWSCDWRDAVKSICLGKELKTGCYWHDAAGFVVAGTVRFAGLIV
jgi:hypothetical protein